jgi:molecular chaperone DnaK (HSP70)
MNSENLEILNNLESEQTITNLCLGIDFGTTNSCLTVWYNNKPLIIPDYDGNETIPTIIEIDLDKKTIGREAYLRKNVFEKTNNLSNNKKSIFLVYEIKKLLGKKYSELDKIPGLNMLAYNIVKDEDSDEIVIYDPNVDKYYYPAEISTHIFMSFKIRAEKYLSTKLNKTIIINDVVLSVPAYYNKNQREIIKNSAIYAGLNVIRLINEPTAAAICYGLGKNSTNIDNIIVFDFGGGTLDVSLLNINDNVYEVLGSCGNNNLGGSDFDNKIMEYCVMEFLKENKDLVNQDNLETFIEEINEDNLQKLKYLSEQAKIALSTNLNTKIKINNFYKNLNLNISLSREDFNMICQDLIRIIIKPINDLLENCNMQKKDINEIIMVGGMTKIPIIRYNIERFFNKDVNCSIDPDNVVSIGCAIHGYMIVNKSTLKNEDKLLLIDRTSLSIGVETSGGIMDVIIPRQSIIPIKKIKKYTTDTDYIDSIAIKIYEGERKFTKDNVLIGDFILSGIEKQKRGIPEVQITFEIDSDGIIKIKAEDLDNPLNKNTILVSGNKQNLNEKQIEEIIENAKKMDQQDRIEKFKKESYISLIDSSNKIIENLNSNDIKIENELKENIKNNVFEILTWLKDNNYENIEIDKYKELLHDYKMNYSIYIIQSNNSNLINLESAEDEKIKKEKSYIEIYDTEDTNKNYIEQIKYFRNIIDEYNDIYKQLKMIQSMNKSNNDDKINNIVLLYDKVNSYANDVLIKFFIENNLNNDVVNEYCTNLNNYDIEFKNEFILLDDEFNIINKLINKLKVKEEEYLNLLEKINSENIENSENIKNSENIENSENIKKINKINEKLDKLIEIDSIIYKINSGYISIENSQLLDIINSSDIF